VNDMRVCSRYVPRHTVLKAFEPEKMGGTTLSMSDHAVLLTIALTVLDDMRSETVLLTLAVSVLAALKALCKRVVLPPNKSERRGTCRPLQANRSHAAAVGISSAQQARLPHK